MAGCVYTREQRLESSLGIPLNRMHSSVSSGQVLNRKDAIVAAVDAPSTIRLINEETTRMSSIPPIRMKLSYDEVTPISKFDLDENNSASKKSSSAKFDVDNDYQVATTSKPAS